PSPHANNHSFHSTGPISLSHRSTHTVSTTPPHAGSPYAGRVAPAHALAYRKRLAPTSSMPMPAPTPTKHASTPTACH
ncbi:unnamed protein product, partial [Dovyalis caffra]